MATDDSVVLIENCGAIKPVACGEDEVMEFLDLGCPLFIELVQIEIEKASLRRTVGLSFVGFDQMRSPKVSNSEVVSRVFPSFEFFIRCA